MDKGEDQMKKIKRGKSGVVQKKVKLQSQKHKMETEIGLNIQSTKIMSNTIGQTDVHITSMH